FFASVRSRSGLDADLEELRSRLERVEEGRDAGYRHAVAGAGRVDTDLQGMVTVLTSRLTALECALNDLLARLSDIEAGLGGVETRQADTERAATEKLAARGAG